MKSYDDLQDYEQEKIDLTIAEYFEANKYTNFLAASEKLNLSVPAVWKRYYGKRSCPKAKCPD